MNTSLLAATRRAAGALRMATHWVKSQEFVNAADDYVYEFYVVLRLLHEGAAPGKVAFVPGAAGRRNVFPRKPANKEGWPRFQVATATTAFQLCVGTRVRATTGEEFGADISLQTAQSPDEPGPMDVLLVWDAKYSTAPGKALPRDEFSSFAFWVEQLGVRQPSAEARAVFAGISGFNLSAIVTNGASSCVSDSLRTAVSVNEVCDFFPGTPHRVLP